jgi:hypothetical protein
MFLKRKSSKSHGENSLSSPLTLRSQTIFT